MNDIPLSSWLVLAAFVLVTLGPALIVSRLTVTSIKTWYQTLRKPPWNPPSWLFGPVWTVLYLAMAVAAWLVWLAQPQTTLALTLYGVQLVLNHAWSPIFFLWRKPGLALVEICLLWCASLLTTVAFIQISPRAGQLLLPYMAWLTFAAALNYRIWRLNSLGEASADQGESSESDTPRDAS